MHLQINHWWNWAKIWWANSLQASPGLNNFWSHSTECPPFLGLWLVEQLPFIFRKTADLIELKFGEQTYWGPICAWLTFGLWMAKQSPAICRYTADQIEIKFGGPTHYVPSKFLCLSTTTTCASARNGNLQKHLLMRTPWQTTRAKLSNISFTINTNSTFCVIWVNPCNWGTYYIPRIRRIGGCYGFTSKPPAARNGVNAITKKPRAGLFSNLVYTLVVIVSWPD